MPPSMSWAVPGKVSIRLKLRSEIRALMARTGTCRRSAWWMCSGQRSPSVRMTRSGAMPRQARAENGHQSIGKYPTPSTIRP